MPTPERDAREMLERLWPISGPETALPIDPFWIAQRLGIRVLLDHSLDPDVSGMLRKRPEYEDPEILLNASDSRNRQRFTCAHELGHYNKRVMTGADDAWEYIDRRDPLSATGKDPEEVYANKFAAELLMPLSLVEARADDPNIASLAIDFGVSADAMSFRLDKLRHRVF